MSPLLCPHCKASHIVKTRLHPDVIVVMPCPACSELSVLFRGRAIPLNRTVLESGTLDERKTHLAEVIAEFLESGFSLIDELRPREMSDEPPGRIGADEPAMEWDGEFADLHPISEEEFQKFVRVDLKCLDNSDYFYRHFRNL